jgi:hypothetical protein
MLKLRRRTSIHTPASLRATNRKLDRWLRRTERVLAAMEAGESLRRSFVHGSGCWQLEPSGQRVADDGARAAVRHPRVVSANDGLFADTPQTFLWSELEERKS